MITKSSKLTLFTMAIVTAIAVLLLVGCTTAATPTSAPAKTSAPAETVAPAAPTDTAVPAPAAKKTFVFGRYMDAINPDPVMNDANADIWYMQQYYNGLTRFKADSTIEADLAESWDVSADGLTYTFKLRPNAKFADGSPITGADWQWSLDRCRNPENGIWAFTVEAVDKVDASDTQVVFTLKQPSAYFLPATAMFNCVVMPAKLVEAAGATFVARQLVATPIPLARTLKKAIIHRGFSFVDVLSPCPTQFGRRNALRSAHEMLAALKNNCISLEKAKAMNPDEVKGKILVGEFVSQGEGGQS